MTDYKKDSNTIANLNIEQYRVTQESGTETTGSGECLNNDESGIDVVSGEPLFASSEKFESGYGWPNFSKPIETIFIDEGNS